MIGPSVWAAFFMSGRVPGPDNIFATCILAGQAGSLHLTVATGDMDITLYRDDWTRISHHPVVQATDILFSVI